MIELKTEPVFDKRLDGYPKSDLRKMIEAGYLVYGSIPNREVAVDLGTVPDEAVPQKLTTRTMGSKPATEDFVRLVSQYGGVKIPAHRRVLMAIQHYRDQGVIDMSDKETVYQAEISGLGTLVFQVDYKSWGVDWAVLDAKGNVVKG